MGTNYYLRKDICDCCGRYDKIHIGKSSAGWVFALHVYPELQINNLDDFLKLHEKDNCKIFDEYDRECSKDDLLSVIFNKKNSKNRLEVDNSFCIQNKEDYDCCIGDFS